MHRHHHAHAMAGEHGEYRWRQVVVDIVNVCDVDGVGLEELVQAGCCLAVVD